MGLAAPKVIRQLKTIERDSREWCQTPNIIYRYKEKPAEIHDILINGIDGCGFLLKGAAGASLSVSTLSVWHASFGLLDLIEGKPNDGWRLIHRGFVGHYWANETYMSQQKKQNKIYSEYVGGVEKVLFFFCVAVHLQQWVLAESYARHIVALYEKGVLAYELDDYEPYLSHFVYGLAMLVLNGKASDFSQISEKSGCYGQLLAHWNDPAALSSSLMDCCDYHVQQAAKGIKGSPYNAFSSVAAALLPFELLAFMCLWSKHHEGATLVCDHPLMRAEFMQYESSAFDYTDDLLERFITSAKAYCAQDV